jgi:hypothetical protein
MSDNKFEALVGFAAIAGVGYVLYLAGGWIYHRFVPAPSVSLAVSAWFEPAAAGGTPQLRVSGVVLEDGKPVAKDRLRLSVEGWKKGISQSIFVDVNQGRFESGDQPAFRGLTPEDRLRIRAEYTRAGATAAEEVYLGARIPRLSRGTAVVVLVVGALCVFGFLWLFTGPPEAGKNTWAIITSYVIMIVFLAVPLGLPPVISVMFPEILAAMRETPVGVLVADPGKGDLGRQWVLNIGGVVVPESQAAARTAPSPAVPASPAATPAEGTAPAQQPAAPASSPPSSSPTANSQTGATSSPGGTRQPAPEESAVTIQGGLVIPLYVLILSLIGGAINMTRKLPDFQRDATSLSMAGAGRALSAAVQSIWAARRFVPGARGSQGPEAAPAEQTEGGQPPSEEQGPPAVQAGATETAGQAPTESAEERLLRQTAEWRKGLITQHMYLLSAPFLAIAVYYLLVWLDLLRQPALVLVSFSVGLISDKILGNILGIASGIVETAPSSGAPPSRT